MKFMQIYLFIMLCLADNVSAKCGKEIKSFVNCYLGARKSIESKNHKSIGFDDFQTKISECFTSNGCKSVRLETVKDSSHKMHREDDEEELLKDTKIYYDCATKVRQNARTVIEKCIQTKLDKDFTLPFDDDLQQLKENIKDHPSQLAQWADNVYHQIYNDTICPSGTAYDKISSCVNDVFEAVGGKHPGCGNQFALIKNFDERRNHICSAGCFKNISKDCAESFNASFPSACICSGKEYENVMNYEKGFNKCIGGITNSTSYRMVESILQNLDKDICHPVPDDPCKNVIKKASSTPKL